jgi:peptidoglycan/LPS O-acetylase OafA/YrhL
MIAMVMASLVAGWFLLLPDDYKKLGASTIANTLFISNIYFWRTTNYFGGANEEKPLLHTWSLAVEEQFYSLIPILIAVLYACYKVKIRRALIYPIVFIIVISLGLSAWGVVHQPYATFFLLPTRAWELAIGMSVAILPVERMFKSNKASEYISALGLFCILVPIFSYNKDTLFPGIAAIPACLGAALIIVSGTSNANFKTRCFRLLAFKPLLGIGIISYSLYLWHWPIFCYYSYWLTGKINIFEKLLLLLATIIISTLSFKLIEKPFRKNGLLKKRIHLFIATIIVAILFIMIGLLIVINNGFNKRFRSDGLATVEEFTKIIDLDSKSIARDTENANNISLESVQKLGVVKKDAPLDFILLGDIPGLNVARRRN